MNGPTRLSEDLKELIGLFQFHHVEFLIVGAHALAFHARPRFTEALDIFYRRTKENAARLRRALSDFGFSLNDASEIAMAEDPRAMMVLGNKPNQVDLLNFLDGVDFELAWSNRVVGSMAGIEVPFISVRDFVATKLASARPKDLADVEQLRDQMGQSFPGDE